MKQTRFTRPVRTFLLALLVIVLGAAGSQVFGALPLSAVSRGSSLAAPATTYPIVDTGQTKCYNNSAEIACPTAGQAFYGQDAQVQGNQPSYTLERRRADRLDNVTGLTWQRSPDTNGDGASRPRQADLDAKPRRTRGAQCGPLWRLQRLAPADDQGTLLADRLPGHRPERDWAPTPPA